MFGGFHDGMGAGGWILMTVFWIGLLMVIAWAIARVVPSRNDHSHESERAPEKPLEVLDGRLARGEIDVETYDQLRAKLTSPPPAAGMG